MSHGRRFDSGAVGQNGLLIDVLLHPEVRVFEPLMMENGES